MDTKSFVRKHNIRIECEWADRNPNMDDDKWQAYHYKVTMKIDRRQMTTYYSMGIAHTKEPTAEDVLDCLASDVAGWINSRSFDDWCGEYGYDTDSRKAYRIYEIVGKQKDQLQKFLGSYDLLEKLCLEVDRL